MLSRPGLRWPGTGEPGLAALCGLLLLAAPARADDAIIVRGTYYGDAWGNVSGGAARGIVQANELDASLTVNLGPATSLYVRGFANSGGSISALAGDALGINNWETGYPAVKLLEAWIDHEFAAGRLALRLGLYDTTTDFDANKTDALFIVNAAGMNTPMVTSGVNGPSTFAATAPALRLRYRLDDRWTAKVAVLDGVPGDPAHPARTVIAIRPGDGALLLSEVRYHTSAGNRVDIGYWRYTARFDRQDSAASVDPVRGFGHQGFYIAGDTMLLHEPDKPLTGISLGGRFAHSDPRYARFSDFVSINITDNALRAGHDDRVGLGIACLQSSPGFRQQRGATGEPVGKRECNVEATYRYYLRPWLTLQPDMQYVLHPTYVPTADHALVFGLRLAVSFDSSRSG